MTVTDEQIIEAYMDNGTKAGAAAALDMPRTTFRRRFDKIQLDRHGTPVGFKTTKVATDGNGNVTARQHKLAPEIDDDERTGEIVRRSTLYGADGSVTGEWVIRKPESKQESFAEGVFESFRNEIPRYEIPEYEFPESQAGLSVINIVDDHMNLRAFAEETGENFDIRTAYDLYCAAFVDLVNSMPRTDEVLLVNLGDQFHANDHMKVTPASKHSLDTDLTFAQAARWIVDLNRFRIEYLTSMFPNVHVRGIRGNHDEDAMVLLFEALKIAYENADNVSVEYFESGTFAEFYYGTLIAYDHGDKGKPDQLAGFIANEYPEYFGQSKYRYLHTGHVHHENEKDVWGGFLWRSHRTLSARDKYTYTNKYHSPRSIKGYTITPHQGETNIAIINV